MIHPFQQPTFSAARANPLHLLLLACWLVLLAGCTPDVPRQRPTTEHVTPSATQEQLLRAMDYLNRPSEFDREQALSQAAYHLNRWLDQQEHDPSWEVDPMTARLPRDIRDRGSDTRRCGHVDF